MATLPMSSLSGDVMEESHKIGVNAGNRGMGRPKGAMNKVTKAAKEAIAEAAELLGGVERIVEWAKEDPLNERAFWSSVYPKLLPLQVSGDPANPLRIHATIGGDA